MKPSLQSLKGSALAWTLFPPTSLRRAMTKLGFVQADPIRSPARAQDLILRHRVRGYAAGDLHAGYTKLGLHEDFLYAYGFLTDETWRLLHPREGGKLKKSEQRILDLVSASKKPLHPRELEAHLGRVREINAWGGYSKATTRALQSLHYRGWLRVAGRDKGIRLYTPQRNLPQEIGGRERLRQLILAVGRILAPLPERSLRATLQHLRYAAPALEGRHSALTDLIEDGTFAQTLLDGLRYLWPAEWKLTRGSQDDQLRFLAPFDPVIWDRRRFEHFWGWAYRFEAYTPQAKRKLGYYAMPMLWREQMIGWVNISRAVGGLDVQRGFAREAPNSPDFERAFDEEVERFRSFLGTQRAEAEAE